LASEKPASVLYNLQSGAAETTLPLPGIFSPDGSAILMQDAIWHQKPLDTLMREARERLRGRELTEDERQRFYL
jgi:hypothetical protein